MVLRSILRESWMSFTHPIVWGFFRKSHIIQPLKCRQIIKVSRTFRANFFVSILYSPRYCYLKWILTILPSIEPYHQCGSMAKQHRESFLNIQMNDIMKTYHATSISLMWTNMVVDHKSFQLTSNASSLLHPHMIKQICMQTKTIRYQHLPVILRASVWV